MHAYSENYLNNAITNFADMMDYDVNDCSINADSYIQMFIASGIAKQFEHGNPKYIVGKSGPELAKDPVFKIKGKVIDIEPLFCEDKSRQYWAGWALGYYQWYTAKAFLDILKVLPFSDIIKMYPTFHEADITKFFDTVDRIIERENTITNLKRIRTAAGISQKALAEQSGVTLRSIQMYEQKNKDINKASAMTIAQLSRVLGCNMEDLLGI